LVEGCSRRGGIRHFWSAQGAPQSSRAMGFRSVASSGDADIATPPTVTADALRNQYDLALPSCKAYDLEDAIESFAPAVCVETAILPLLNDLRHLEMSQSRFGDARVLGGQCVISVTVDSERRVRHLKDKHLLSFGELNGSRISCVEMVASALAGAKFDARVSVAISGNVGEVGVHRRRRRNHVSDARDDRRHRGRECGGFFSWPSRRMLWIRSQRRPCKHRYTLNRADASGPEQTSSV
jgi:Ketopantoate reductase PanE/ApbA